MGIAFARKVPPAAPAAAAPAIDPGLRAVIEGSLAHMVEAVLVGSMGLAKAPSNDEVAAALGSPVGAGAERAWTEALDEMGF